MTPVTMNVTQEELKLAVEKVLEMGLVGRIQSQILSQTGDLELTENGRSIASRPAEIQLILSERKQLAPNHRLGNLPVARKLTEDEARGMEEEWRSSKRGLRGSTSQ